VRFRVMSHGQCRFVATSWQIVREHGGVRERFLVSSEVWCEGGIQTIVTVVGTPWQVPTFAELTPSPEPDSTLPTTTPTTTATIIEVFIIAHIFDVCR
jgi:coproporphyrinogen III oxidase